MDINTLLAAKRAAELAQEKQNPLEILNITAALKDTAREFSKKGEK